MRAHRLACFLLPLTFVVGFVRARPVDAARGARALIDAVGLERGLIVLVGEGHGELARDLAQQTEWTVYVETPGSKDASSARRLLDRAGLLGARVLVDQSPLARLDLAGSLADALVLADGIALTDATRLEAMRVLRPGGKLIAKGETFVRPRPQGAGDWSHPYHGPDNNPLATDRLARAPYMTRFLATPWYGPMPEVTVISGGRMFKAFGYIAFKEREWDMLNKLVAINAYNGIELWRRELTPGFMVHRNTIIATPDRLYLGDNDACRVIDAASGEVVDRIVVDAKDGGPCWKWMALRDDSLIALLGEREPLEEVLRGTRRGSGWPWGGLGKGYAKKDYHWGHGRTIVALDPKTKKERWRYVSDEPLDSRAFCMNRDRLFIYSHRKFVEAIRLDTGERLWRSQNPELLAAIGEHDRAQTWKRGYASQTYAKCSEDVVFFAGPQRRKIVAFSAKDGYLLWTYPKGNYQLVLKDGALYAMGKTSDSKKLDPRTGRVIADIDCLRGNCTRATGTADSIFARGDQHGGTLRLDVDGDVSSRLPAMRPACQDGVIAANGLLYWGPWMCDCNHSLTGIVSLGTAGEFEFGREADEGTRLERLDDGASISNPLEVDDRDWPTYRANRQRSAVTSSVVTEKPRLLWQLQTPTGARLTAPVVAGGLVFVGGDDGAVRSYDVRAGDPVWWGYTGGRIFYPPTVAEGRVLVGSGDGRAYAFDARGGRPLWRFRAAPRERKIPVYGHLTSTWPVASGIAVREGVAYLAAGIASHDGTHVYALDAASGRIRWQNNDSGRLMGDEKVCGVSVQGHLLLDGDRLYLAGGNVVSPGVFDVGTGRCLNTLEDEWQKAPRGSELFLSGGQVAVVDKQLYSPRDYIPSRYFAKYLVQAGEGDISIQGSDKLVARVSARKDAKGRPRVIWKDDRFVQTSAVVLAKNAVLVLGQSKSDPAGDSLEPVLVGLHPDTGREVFQRRLPAPAVSWGLAVDRDGRMIVTLIDGRVLCFAG